MAGARGALGGGADPNLADVVAQGVSPGLRRCCGPAGARAVGRGAVFQRTGRSARPSPAATRLGDVRIRAASSRLARRPNIRLETDGSEVEE